MIIVHENLSKEAIEMSRVIEEVLEIKSKLINHSIESILTPIPKFDGYTYRPCILLETELSKVVPEGKNALLLTPRDLYYQAISRNDDWIFGFSDGRLSVVSGARMKRCDNKPSQDLEVPFDLYFRRLSTMAIHEIGHTFPNAEHFKEATWVNVKTGHRLNLGLHCTDNRCVMYEVVDVKSPSEAEGYMQLGNEKRYNAGLDNLNERIHPGFFCNLCRPSIRIDERYI